MLSPLRRAAALSALAALLLLSCGSEQLGKPDDEVRANAVDIAVAAARKLLADRVDASVADSLFKSSVQDLKTKLN